ncbi:MAG TPA: ABC transporter permease [Caulobacteraceae bacterium]|nr:ABC transporter permease [Caulobacteraceae bacterium]
MNAPVAPRLELTATIAFEAVPIDCAKEAVPPAGPRKARRLGRGDKVAFGWLLGPFLLLLAWTTGSAAGLIDARILPSPWATLATAVGLIGDGRLQANLAVSALRAGEGFAWGVLAGSMLGLVAGLSQLGDYAIDGLVQIKRSIPTLALIPLLVLWFGIGETMKVTVIAISVFIPMYIQLHTALRGVDVRRLELAETLGLSRWRFIRHVVLPGTVPGFMTGLRFGVMGAWLALVVVEQLNATSGIGYMINLARTYAQSDVILVGLVVYALLGLTSDAAVRWLEARVLVWRRTLAG